jgi:hypothetical protein
MADSLSLAASIIAVAQVSDKVVLLCFDYRLTYNHTNYNFTRLVNEAKSFRDFLEALVSNIDARRAGTMTSHRTKLLMAIGGPLTEALDNLKQPEGKLECAKGWQGFKRNLKWPLEETETLKSLDRLNRI